MYTTAEKIVVAVGAAIGVGGAATVILLQPYVAMALVILVLGVRAFRK